MTNIFDEEAAKLEAKLKEIKEGKKKAEAAQRKLAQLSNRFRKQFEQYQTQFDALLAENHWTQREARSYGIATLSEAIRQAQTQTLNTTHAADEASTTPQVPDTPAETSDDHEQESGNHVEQTGQGL